MDVSSQAVLDEVCGWLAALTSGPVLLAGASYGGYLAAAVARQHPTLVRGLLLVCPGVRLGHRTLPTGAPPPAPADWLDDVPIDLHEHLDQAIGHRTRTVAARVSTALAAGPDGDTTFQEALRASPGYALADETSDTNFDGPVTVLAGRQDRIAGYADQFAVMSRYPRGTYAVLDDAGHYLPFKQPSLSEPSPSTPSASPADSERRPGLPSDTSGTHRGPPAAASSAAQVCGHPSHRGSHPVVPDLDCGHEPSAHQDLRLGGRSGALRPQSVRY